MAIKPSEVKAHCELSGVALDAVEYKLLRDLDSEFVRFYCG